LLPENISAQPLSRAIEAMNLRTSCISASRWSLRAAFSSRRARSCSAMASLAPLIRAHATACSARNSRERAPCFSAFLLPRGAPRRLGVELFVTWLCFEHLSGKFQFVFLLPSATELFVVFAKSAAPNPKPKA
jgi:hypothetical protein